MTISWEQKFRKASKPSADFGLDTSDLLAYRKAWDPYVMGVARAEKACAAQPGLDPTLASVHSGSADTIVYLWNQYAGSSSQDILLSAASMLKGYQDSVLHAGQAIVGIKRDCPAIAAKIPAPPSLAEQAQIHARLDGAGIATSGVLSLLGVGLNGALTTVESPFVAVGQAAQKIGKIPTWVFVAGAGVVGLVVLMPIVAPVLLPALAMKKALK